MTKSAGIRTRCAVLAALFAIQPCARDYGAWRDAYDRLAEVREDRRVLDGTIHQLDDAPNTVPVPHHVATVAQARGFLTSRELEAAMQRAGVQGMPRVEIYF